MPPNAAAKPTDWLGDIDRYDHQVRLEHKSESATACRVSKLPSESRGRIVPLTRGKTRHAIYFPTSVVVVSLLLGWAGTQRCQRGRSEP
jgi:hypothetical protein